MQGYADTFIPAIPIEHEQLHTPTNPFCPDTTCGCHEDERLREQVAQQVQDGLLTPLEASQFTAGKTL